MYRHHHIDRELDPDNRSYSKSYDRSKLIVGIHGNFEAAVYKRDKQCEQDNGSDETPFLTENGKDEVCMVLGYELQFVLRPGHKTLAEKFPRTYRDYGLLCMITEPCGIGIDIDKA